MIFPARHRLRRWSSGKSCDIGLRLAGSSQTGQLLILFHNVSSVLTKTPCQHSSQVPRSRIKAFMCRPRCCFPRLCPPELTNQNHHCQRDARFLWLKDNELPLCFRHCLFLTCSYRDNPIFSRNVTSQTCSKTELKTG